MLDLSRFWRFSFSILWWEQVFWFLLIDRCGPVQCSTMHLTLHSFSLKLCSVTIYRKTQCSAVQCSAGQCSPIQCSAVQCSAVQCTVNSVHCKAYSVSCTVYSEQRTVYLLIVAVALTGQVPVAAPGNSNIQIMTKLKN